MVGSDQIILETTFTCMNAVSELYRKSSTTLLQKVIDASQKSATVCYHFPCHVLSKRLSYMACCYSLCIHWKRFACVLKSPKPFLLFINFSKRMGGLEKRYVKNKCLWTGRSFVQVQVTPRILCDAHSHLQPVQAWSSGNKFEYYAFLLATLENCYYSFLRPQVTF